MASEGDKPQAREIVEGAKFVEALSGLGNLKRLDDALRGVVWAISTNPEVFEVVEGFKDVRLVKTDPIGDLPPLRIWFRIEGSGNRVVLDYIEPIDI